MKSYNQFMCEVYDLQESGQIDLAENLSIKKVTYANQELSFSREFDAVLIDFISTIKKGSIFEFTVFYKGVPQSADNPPWAQGGLSAL